MDPFHVDSAQLVLKLIFSSTFSVSDLMKLLHLVLFLICRVSNNNNLSEIPRGSVTVSIKHLGQTHHSPTHSASQPALANLVCLYQAPPGFLSLGDNDELDTKQPKEHAVAGVTKKRARRAWREST